MQSLADYPDMRVLVAEDNLGNQRLIEAILQSQGVEAMFVCDGAAALAETERAAFDLILIDIAMPVMDGVTAVRLIRELEAREERASTLIYVVSSQHEARDLLVSRTAGADGHLAKPLMVTPVLAALADGLQLMRARTGPGRAQEDGALSATAQRREWLR